MMLIIDVWIGVHEALNSELIEGTSMPGVAWTRTKPSPSPCLQNSTALVTSYGSWPIFPSFEQHLCFGGRI